MTRAIFLTLASALLAICAFAPVGWSYLALVAWLPFLVVLKEATPRAGFYLGLFHGMVLFGGTLSWMWNIFGAVSLVLWAMLAFFTAVSALLITKLSAKSTLQSSALIAMIWTGVEFYRAEVFALTFPWITPGTGFLPNWITPIVGVYGVTFVIIFANCVAIRNWKAGIAGIFALGLSAILFPEAEESDQGVRVGLVQDESAVRDRLVEASLPFLEEVEAVVWPEYALNDIDESDLKMAKQMAGESRLFVASGLETRDGVEGNTAIIVSKEGVIGQHIKNHPVHFFSDGVAGQTAEITKTHLGKIGTPICFDCDHQDVIRKMTADGAEFFLIPSLDAIHWSARQHEQHGVLFRHRAAENGRWLAVASSSGVTQLIDSRGHVRDRLPLMKEGTLIGEVFPENGQTLFQQVGWLIGPASMVGVALAIVWITVRKFISARPPEDDTRDSSGSILDPSFDQT